VGFADAAMETLVKLTRLQPFERESRPTVSLQSRPCSICGELSPCAYLHPEARIYRCPKCAHAFSELVHPSVVEQYTAEYYEDVHRNWFAHPNIRLFKWIESQLPHGMRSLLDVGCGRGRFLDFLRKDRPSLRLAGVDLSRNENRNGIEFHCGDIFALELGTFDAVVSLATIEHVADVGAFTRRLASLCNPGGVVVVMTLNDGSLLYRVARLGHRFGASMAFNRVYSAHHLHHFSKRSLSELLERNGLHVRTRQGHSVPIRAIDIPVRNAALRPVMQAASAALLALGNATATSYLQTVVAVR
jgi:2-polyprenyl-3-methyl-5-hydroxy-6-metoxy-1,4-benzoquinol methylase